MPYCCNLTDLGLKLSIDASPGSFGCTVTDGFNRAIYSISEGRPRLDESSRDGRFATDRALSQLCRYINRSVRTHLCRFDLPDVLSPDIFWSCFLGGKPLPDDTKWYLRESELEVIDVAEAPPFLGVLPQANPDLAPLRVVRRAAGGR